MNQPSQTILIVEDEQKIASLLADYLEKTGGFATRWLDRGDTVLESVTEEPPDLILLDLMLPGLGGLEVCKAVRRISNVPIIMVTAMVEEIDRLLGLELGADDYICKPFSPREVVARVKSVLRRAGSTPAALMPFGLEIDGEAFSARINGVSLKLTPVEFALLKHLASHPARVFSRDQLMDAAYSDYRVVSDRTVDTHIKNLRKKLAEAAPGADLIESVYGVGYRLVN